MKSIIAGVGGYLPEKVLTNFDLEKMVETSDAWIRERTGIRLRHIAADDQTTSSLATKAGEDALKNAGISGEELDLIILATTTPDDTTPATAMRVQAGLGATKAFAFDVQAACSGFMYALSVADKFIKAGTVKTALVIGAETLSRIVDWSDRNTCVLFGDGAGAVVLQAKETEHISTTEEGILDIVLHSDGRLRDLLTTTGGVSRTQTAGFVHMEGREVFRHAVTNLSNVAQEVIDRTGISLSDIDFLVPHQANIRIIEGTAKKLDIDLDKVIITLPEQGNTSAASIPLALYEGIKSQKLKKGQLILLDAMGAGFTWAGALIRL
ncbi:MAG: ketoacyl-ACP synthase III [Alphaproteobacteria bacterium]|nr:ketoacyl-ACP synthase III [Alphaproteobacteria bacterium]